MPDEETITKETTTPQYITKEDFASAMREQQTRIAGAMDIFGDQVSKAILDVKGQPVKETDTTTTTTETRSDGKTVRDEAIALIDDPDGYISKLIDKKLANSEDINSIRSDLFVDRVMELETEFDEEYGEGSFKEQIMPDLLKAAGELPAKMRASKSHMSMLASGIKGRIPADKLVEKRLAAKKAQEEKAAPAMLRGVGVPRSQGDKLDAEETSYLDSLRAKGIEYSKEEYLRDRKLGSDMDSAVEAMNKK